MSGCDLSCLFPADNPLIFFTTKLSKPLINDNTGIPTLSMPQFVMKFIGVPNHGTRTNFQQSPFWGTRSPRLPEWELFTFTSKIFFVQAWFFSCCFLFRIKKQAEMSWIQMISNVFFLTFITSKKKALRIRCASKSQSKAVLFPGSSFCVEILLCLIIYF